MTGSIKTKLGREMGLGPSHIVLDGDPAPPKGGGAQQPHPIFCPRIVANSWTWIKMPFGMEAGLGPGDIVLDGDPTPPKRGHCPHFSTMSVVAKRLDGLRCHLVRR